MRGTCIEVAFTKSSRCEGGSCVEVGHHGDDVLVRDGKDPDGPVLKFTRAEWEAFVAGVQAGEFS